MVERGIKGGRREIGLVRKTVEIKRVGKEYEGSKIESFSN